MRRSLVATATLCFLMTCSVAIANPPDRSQQTVSGTAVVTDVCSFPVTVDYTVDLTLTNFYDADGNLVRIHVAADESDVYRANGKSLTSVPFHYSQEVIFDADGNVTNVFSNGLVAKTQLPDGSMFVSAGRLDFIARDANFVLTPDVGTSGNIAGFCAALAP